MNVDFWFSHAVGDVLTDSQEELRRIQQMLDGAQEREHDMVQQQVDELIKKNSHERLPASDDGTRLGMRMDGLRMDCQSS